MKMKIRCVKCKFCDRARSTHRPMPMTIRLHGPAKRVLVHPPQRQRSLPP